MLQKELDGLRAFARGVAALREAHVLRSNSFTGDIGEWYAARFLGGIPARSRTQKGWDVEIRSTGEHLQVRTQTYDPKNKWNYFEGDRTGFSHLVVVLLENDFRLREMFKIPSAEIPLRRGKGGKLSYRWKDLSPWSVPLEEAPGYPDLVDLIVTRS